MGRKEVKNSSNKTIAMNFEESQNEEFEIYFHYVSIQLGLKYNFEILDLTKQNTGWSKPDNISPAGTVGYKYLWKDLIKIQTLEQLKEENSMYNFNHYKNLYYNQAIKQNRFCCRKN